MKESNFFPKSRQFFISKLFYPGTIIILSFLLIPLCCHFSYAEGISPQNPKTILVLHTFKGKRPWNLLFNKYLTESLKQSNLGPYKLEIENLDLVEFNNDYHKETLKKLLAHKYSNPSPDIIIITFSLARKFVVENNLFPDVPKIIISVVGGGFSDTHDSAVISMYYDFKGNIEHCLTLMPGTKNIYVVAGNSNMDKRIVNRFKNAVEELNDSVSLHYLTELGVEATLSRVENLPRDSIVYFLTYTQDDQGNAVLALDLCKQLGRRANRPVFAILDILALGTGILGGRVTTTRYLAAGCTEIIKKVFQGKAIDSIKIEKPFFDYIYDWTELRKWGIDEAQLPPGSIIQNKKYTLWGQYKGPILIGIILIILESFLVVYLLLSIKTRKKAEEALQESEKKFRKLFENSPFGVMVCQITKDAQGKPVDFIHLQANPSTSVQLGMKLADLVGKKATEIADEKTSAHFIRLYGEVVRTGTPCSLEYYFSHHDRTLQVTAFHMTGDLFILNFTDITERKLAEEQLNRLRLYLKNMFDSMPSVLVGVDEEGLVTQWNRTAERLTGLSEQEAQGRPLDQVMPSLSSQMQTIREAISTRTPQMKQKIPEQVNDETRYADIMVYPLIANGVEGAVIRADDVTDRVRIEQMMIQTEKMMSVGGLAAGMAHEINNPLGAVMQGVQNATRRISPDLEANQKAALECGTDLTAIRTYLEKRSILKYLDGMREASSRAAKIVSNMLSFSRRSESKLAPIEINALMDSVLELADSDYDLKKKYDFRHVNIVRDYETGLSQVPCTATEIEQVFLNIHRNAAEAMAEGKDKKEGPLRAVGSTSRRPRITIRTRKEKDHARIEIEDNGPGMDEKTRKRVFEPFFTTKPVGVGTGLGLSVSYFIVTNNHNGTMTVESEPGKGSRFIIRLPLERK